MLRSRSQATRWLRCFFVATPLLLACTAGRTQAVPAAFQAHGQTQTVRTAVPATQRGVPYTAAQLDALLPPSVYFQGKTAPLQLRNAGGVPFAPNAVVWAALVDTSGYATAIQERYQFYLVTEAPLQIGETRLSAGAYGGGFVNDRFVIMDLGGHPVAEGSTQTDAALPRPRPLQILPDAPDSVKLYLGRHWVRLHSGADAKPS